ncbi:hypothetical protein HAZT_HAZT008587 [Hyalella azteca]|uniref:Uncharacterized protein n=1 Tax=Hyalella azteca TaxID=294128 RepID=A0A6A0GQS0_HYAAZ|nr:hypothetical protein HAZT_HAZT008587 [Hyalella azteca]
MKFAGSPCGQHGSYVFYKGLRYTSPPPHAAPRLLALGEFVFLKIWPHEDIVSIGEPQLMWEDRASGNLLVSLKLYFRPENTPEGRSGEHGEMNGAGAFISTHD